MFSNFTEEARNIIVLAKQEMKKLKHPYVGSEHLLLAILKDENNISNTLKKYNLDNQTSFLVFTYVSFSSTISILLFSSSILRISLNCAAVSPFSNASRSISQSVSSP